MLAYFLHRYLDFRLPELESLAELCGLPLPLEWRLPDGGLADSPFWRLKLPSLECAAELASRSLLLKVLIDVWGEGSTMEECVNAVLAHPGTISHRSLCRL